MSTSQVTAVVAHLVTLPPDAGSTTDAAAAVEPRDPPEIEALVRQAKAGDRAAFGDLVRIHQRVVFRTALAALGAREDAEDATQDAFVVAWRKLDGFRGDSSFRTWLLTITWRKALDKRRVRLLWWKRSAAWLDDGSSEGTMERVAGPAPDPEAAAVTADLLRQARRAIEDLSPTLRDTLLLAASGEHSYEQIAALLGVPLGTVKWRVSEARRRVAERMAP